jgi:acyl-CoA hydrolase
MIKIETILRLRIGAHDAHYAGGLVDGAKMLQLFGDVATEILIRLDGDEGLFRAYEKIEFLAPVYAGDYIEVRGVLSRIGKTSRTIEFEAAKVIQSLHRERGGLAASSAEVLDIPLLVCRAVGTCVTPLPLQRVKRS